MPRRALRLTQDLPDLSVPLTAGAVLRESDCEPGALTVAVRLTGDVAEALRRRFRAAGATPVILPGPEDQAA
jgi:hypothetical protein